MLNEQSRQETVLCCSVRPESERLDRISSIYLYLPFFMPCTLYLIYLVSSLNFMLLPGSITSHTLKYLTYKPRNGTVEVKSKREEVKTHKNKFLLPVNLILVFRVKPKSDFSNTPNEKHLNV